MPTSNPTNTLKPVNDSNQKPKDFEWLKDQIERALYKNSQYFTTLAALLGDELICGSNPNYEHEEQEDISFYEFATRAAYLQTCALNERIEKVLEEYSKECIIKPETEKA